MFVELVIPLLLALLCGYLIGSVNFAILICRLTGKDDIRNHGSKNAGMTNMLRIYGKIPAAFTLIGDFSKGILAILLARLIFRLFGCQQYSIFLEYLVGIAAVLGHIYPVFYRFKGGKGVMISAGIALLLTPVPVGCALVVFAVVVLCTKTVSIASISATACAPLLVMAYGLLIKAPSVWVETGMTTVLAIFIIAMHRQNIGRIIRGEENKFGKSKKDS